MLHSIYNKDVLIVSAAVFAAYALFGLLKRAFAGPAYKARPALLTKTEIRCYKAINKVTVNNGYTLMAQVRIADILSVNLKRDTKHFWDAFKKISSKHIDFVIVHPDTFRIVAGIEIDDKSHAEKDRMQRDTFVNRAFRQAGVYLLRCSPADISALLNDVDALLKYDQYKNGNLQK